MGSQDPGEGISDNWNEEEGDLEASKDVKVVDWEDFHDAFVHLGGVAVNLTKVRAKKSALSGQLETVIEKGTKALQRVDALEAMQRRLREKQSDLESAIASLHELSGRLVRTRERLLPSAQALLLSAKALASAQGRIQEADRLLAGEGGYGRLLQFRKLLDARRREMVVHVACLYPLASCTSLGSSSNHKLTASSLPQPQLTGVEVSSSSVDELSMAIAGLQLLVPVKKQSGLFTEKNDYETSATALGYVAHVVSLVASYLDVPLRYPVRLGASRSYIQDHCPATEPATVETGAILVPPTKHGVEFPLFSEGQELTRSAYAVFLLNKDLEQILNKLGVESVGPRHTLPNLNRVINIVTTGIHPLA